MRELMVTAGRAIPRRQLQRALTRITEHFACTVGAAQGVGFARSSAPRWNASDWRIARAVASMHGVSGWMAQRVRWSSAPDDWREFLQGQHAQTAARHERLLDLQQQVDAAARDAGLSVMMLKGAALHAAGLYSSGERPMADLDLLVAPADADRAARIFDRLGFLETEPTWKHRTFEPREECTPGSLGECATNSLKIELHMQLHERLPRQTVDISDFATTGVQHPPGLSGYPSLHAMMLHLLLHAAGALVFRALRLMHLNDIAIVAQRLSPLDWTAMMTRANASACGFWWAYPPLVLAARYFNSIPAIAIDGAEDHCHWTLRSAAQTRSLSDVSLSNARISAFPGIAWARSPAEALAHARYRLLPDREVRDLRRLQARLVPGAGESRWARQTQLTRMARALLASPVRPETLSAVRAAFQR